MTVALGGDQCLGEALGFGTAGVESGVGEELEGEFAGVVAEPGRAGGLRCRRVEETADRIGRRLRFEERDREQGAVLGGKEIGLGDEAVVEGGFR